MPSVAYFTIHQAGEMERFLSGRQVRKSDPLRYETVGIGSLAEIDSGYDPLPLAVERMAWTHLYAYRTVERQYLRHDTVAAIAAIRRGLEALYGRDITLSALEHRYGSDANPRDPMDRVGPESFSLLSLVQRLADVGGTGGHTAAILAATSERVGYRLQGPGADDTAALSAIFP